MADKLKAFELYGKAMGYYAERREITGADRKLIGVNNHITVEFIEPGNHSSGISIVQPRRASELNRFAQHFLPGLTAPPSS